MGDSTMAAPPATLLTILLFAGVRSSFVTERNPRLFYVSSATSTSLATTQCFIADDASCRGGVAGNPTACPACAFVQDKKRRRRALPDDVDLVDQVDHVAVDEDSFQRWEVVQMDK